MKYPLKAINSADDAAGLWVAIGYQTKDREQHALFIVGGELDDAGALKRNVVPIYFERDDQSLSCYEGAEKMVVSDHTITLILNKNGMASLEMPKRNEFAAEKPDDNFTKARKIFAEMQKRKSGEIIHLE